MRIPIDPSELFVGAVVSHTDIDTFTAVVTNLHDGMVDLVDIYGWHPSDNRPLDTVFPNKMFQYVLVRMGFEIDRPVPGDLRFTRQTDQGPLVVVGNDGLWLLSIGRNNIEIQSSHHLQNVCRTLFKINLEVTEPVEVEEDQED